MIGLRTVLTDPRAPVALIAAAIGALVAVFMATGSNLLAGALWLAFAAACGYSISGSV